MGFFAPLTFAAITDDGSGQQLKSAFDQRWPAYAEWLLNAERQKALPREDVCLRQLREHMPKLVPTLDRLLGILGAREHLVQFLCLYNPPTFIAGCSQAVWKRESEIALIRNYDFPQSRWDGLQLYSHWNSTGVIAMTDCIWGVLDGINEHGLAVSLSFGGKLIVGDGFGITLVLRYILEFCENCDQAEAFLQRVPIALAYNIVLSDRNMKHAVVSVGPGQRATSTQLLCATNHQKEHSAESNLDILSDSNARLQFLAARLADSKESLDHFLRLFQQPPLYRKVGENRGWGTLYTASYHPHSGVALIQWPKYQLKQSFENFSNCELQIEAPSA